MHLFELFAIENVKIEQWNRYILLTGIGIGRKSTNQGAQHMVENWRGFRMLFTDGQHGFRFTAKIILIGALPMFAFP